MCVCRSALFCGHKCSLGPWLCFWFHNFQDLHLVCCMDLQSLQEQIPIKYHYLIPIHTVTVGVELWHLPAVVCDSYSTTAILWHSSHATGHFLPWKGCSPHNPRPCFCSEISDIYMSGVSEWWCHLLPELSAGEYVRPRHYGGRRLLWAEGHHRQSEGQDQSGSVSGYLPRLRCRWATPAVCAASQPVKGR